MVSLSGWLTKQRNLKLLQLAFVGNVTNFLLSQIGLNFQMFRLTQKSHGQLIENICVTSQAR